MEYDDEEGSSIGGSFQDSPRPLCRSHAAAYAKMADAVAKHDAAMSVVDGGYDLLMCYHPAQLNTVRYKIILLSSERLAFTVHRPRKTTPASS